ncbi:hypothetical protein ABAC460_01185 [Asticcacaulis sp. AC460]|uniref:DUF5985 family protein n=1 Tax=Asticcacaulis sp. AC460 TaxID=1282360 RepID=UPI0003C3B0A0|nr:DUF5985 family protein [Asticcacaulis sp. AC460]ESQ93348.1 hypothetical protein ABAC460_01185 [Asticcacaulis sp. AC460]
MTKLLLLGALAMGSFIISLIFIRFWKTTRDRFFLFFAAAFFIEAVRRVMLGVIPYSTEQEPLFFLLQAVAFGAIVYAIIDKNRAGRSPNL